MSSLALGNLWAWGIQVAAIAAVGLVLPVLLRVTSPKARLVYLRGLLIACLVLPAIQPWVPLQVSPSAPDAALAGVLDTRAEPSGGQATAPSAPRRAAAEDRPVWPWPLEQTIAGLVVAGMLGRLVWLGIGLWSLARLRSRSRPLDPLPDAVDDAMRAVGARAAVLESGAVERPVTFGLRRPVVIVPEDYRHLAAEEQRTIAIHELLHVRRRDWIRTIGDELVRAVLWFHPAIWWLIDQIHLGIEQVVDREVVRLSGARRPYLEALLKMAASRPVPLLRPASMFLKQRHLAQRVASLVKEASMSRIRLAVSFTAVGLLLVTSGYFVVSAFPLRAMLEPVVLPSPPPLVAYVKAPPPTSPPLGSEDAVVLKDASNADRPEAASGGSASQQTKPVVDPKLQTPRPGMATPAPGAPPDEPTLRALIAQNPADPSYYYALAKLLEDQRRYPEAEQTLLNAKGTGGNVVQTMLVLAGYYNRRGDFERCVATLKERADIEPGNPEAFYTLATYYWDKAFRDKALSDMNKQEYVASGLDAVDEALRLKPDYYEALTYRSLLLRLKATMEQDPAAQQALTAEADAARAEAIAMRNREFGIPPDAVRVGGTIPAPTKLRDVRPEYPEAARAARVAGVVIVEALIGPDGNVVKARVLRSIPMLDEAALTAVKQWVYTPTIIDGKAVPVVMTATVNFTPADGSLMSFQASPPPPPPPPPPTGGVSGGVVGGITGGVSGGVSKPDASSDPWYPTGIVKIGGTIRPPQKIVNVPAVYPEDAKAANVQGVVIIEAAIGTDGRVTKARVLRSIPMLDQAALDAVRLWEFTPTLLNGQAVPVVMTVTVNFTMR